MVVVILTLVILFLLGWYFYRQLVEYKEDKLSKETVRNNRIAILVAIVSIFLVVFFGYPREDNGETIVVDVPETSAKLKDTLTQNLAVKPEKAVEIVQDSVSLPEQIVEEKKLVKLEKEEPVKEEKEEPVNEKKEEVVKVKEESIKAGTSVNFFPKHRGVTFGPRRKEKLDFLGMNADSLEARLNAAINKGGNAKTKAVIQYYLTSEWLDRESKYLSKARSKFNIDANNRYFNALVDSVKTQSYLAKPRRK